MTDCKGRNVIYHMKPAFELNAEFKDSGSMYKLKNLQTSPIATNETQADVNDASVGDVEILTRQEKLLSNLYQLQKEVSAFQSKIHQLKSQNIQNTDYLSLFNKAEVRDFVINADPSYPPYALLWLPKLWNLSINITIHVHSSVQSLYKNLSVFDKLKSDRVDTKYPTMTLVWKKVGPDTQLVVSPIKYKTVLGEVNILRFFDYILNPNEDNLQHIRMNDVLDLVHRLNHVSNRDQPSILPLLQKRLGNEKWFNVSPTIVDAAVWSSLSKLRSNTIPAALNKYMDSCTEFIGINLSS